MMREPVEAQHDMASDDTARSIQATRSNSFNHDIEVHIP